MSRAPKLELNQFSEIQDLIMALCFKQAGKLDTFTTMLNKRGNVSYNIVDMMHSLGGRKLKVKRSKKNTVDPSRFQVMDVDEDCSIREFVEDYGLTFKKGRGFYEFTKKVTIQSYKEVIAQDKKTGEIFSGDEARRVLGIAVGRNADVSPSPYSAYRGFVQSTSVNRKLLKNTRFLYEVDYSI